MGSAVALRCVGLSWLLVTQLASAQVAVPAAPAAEPPAAPAAEPEPAPVAGPESAPASPGPGTEVAAPAAGPSGVDVSPSTTSPPAAEENGAEGQAEQAQDGPSSGADAAASAPPPSATAGSAAPAPAPLRERAAEQARGECTTQDLLRGLCDEVTVVAKPWRILAQITLATPVVQDPSPENDTLMVYYLGGELDLPWPGFYATAFLGLSQQFWRYQGEAALDWLDPMVGVGYRGTADIGDRSLIMVHRASLYFPLSRSSRYNLYYTAADWLTALRLPLVGQLLAGLNLRGRYTFYEHGLQDADGIDDSYADAGGANTRAAFEIFGLLQQGLFDDPEFGNLILQGGIGYRHQLRYDGSGVPAWGWSVGASYTPIQYLSIALSLEQPSFAYNLGYSGLNRGGVIRIVGFDRDETAWNFSLYGRF